MSGREYILSIKPELDAIYWNLSEYVLPERREHADWRVEMDRRFVI